MLTPGQLAELVVEKPAVGGRMIARVSGQIVLVSGAIPGERVTARIERTSKGVVYATTVGVEEPSPDRRALTFDPLCGGCLYAHVAYQRQLQLKSQVIADAFTRIGRLPIERPVAIVGSPTEGYRMRARLHRDRDRLGFFREGTHEVCDCRPTGQLLQSTCEALERLGRALTLAAPDTVREVELSENVEATDRVAHLHAAPHAETVSPAVVSSIEGFTGVTSSAAAGFRVLSGTPVVTDVLPLGDERGLSLQRHVLSFFQGNRFLLGPLTDSVVRHIPRGSRVVDLYSGGGLLSVAAARLRGAQVTAVEGDRWSAVDLAANARTAGGAVSPIHQSVEGFLQSGRRSFDVVLLDPPRTGLSKDALAGIVRLGGPQISYVSCDVATLARDARRLVDAGYQLIDMEAFDLFPNTPHVETVARFEKRDGAGIIS